MKLTDEEKAARKVKREELRVVREEENRVATLARQEAVAEAYRKRWANRRMVVLNRGVFDPPIHVEHSRAKNWAAIVMPDPTQPGGFSRIWWDRGRGDFRYIVPSRLKVGDIVEFGADYVQWSGKKVPERWLGVVVERTDTVIEFKPVRDMAQAIQETSMELVEEKTG